MYAVTNDFEVGGGKVTFSTQEVIIGTPIGDLKFTDEDDLIGHISTLISLHSRLNSKFMPINWNEHRVLKEN